MLPAGSGGQNYVITIDADEPVNSTDKADEKKIQRWSADVLFQFGIQADGDKFGDNGGDAQNVSDPDHRHGGRVDARARKLGLLCVGWIHSAIKVGDLSVTLGWWV